MCNVWETRISKYQRSRTTIPSAHKGRQPEYILGDTIVGETLHDEQDLVKLGNNVSAVVDINESRSSTRIHPDSRELVVKYDGHLIYRTLYDTMNKMH